MAKKATKKRKKRSSSGGIVLYSVNRDVIRFISGFAFGFLAIFTIASLTSYLFTWAEDQSLLSHSDILSNLVDAENQGGKLGFIWSNILVSRLFGLGAFVIPFFFGALSIYCFRIKNVNILRLTILSLMGCIIASMTFSYIFSFTNFTDLFGEGIGGSYGFYVNEWLSSMLGAVGLGCVIMLLLIIWVVLLNDKIVDKITAYIDRWFKEREARNAALRSLATGDEDLMLIEDELEELDDEDDEDDDEIEELEEEKNKDEIEFEIIENEIPVIEAGQFIEEGIVESIEDNSVQDTEQLSGQLPVSLPPQDSQAPTNELTPSFEVIEGQEVDFSKSLSDDMWSQKYDPRLSLSKFILPPLSLLEEYRDQWYDVPRDELEKNNRKIISTLKDYKISVSKISAQKGPTITLYKIVPAPGVRVSQIKRLEEDIALSLAARGVRVVTLVGTNAIGIEVANEKSSIVSMRSVLEDPKFRNAKFDLPIVLGRTISNEVMTFDLAKMPHLLVAGATGQGKSVGLNAIITSLLYKKHPSELKFVLVDPKKVELSLYEPLEKHYLAKLPDADEAIITDTQKVVYTLRSLCKLMDSRYDLLKLATVRNVKEYNEKFLSRRLNPNKGHEYMPYIVVIIDEFADLLMTAGREVEEPIARLAQLARAIGIHLVIATQRPTTNIITGSIKANFPARIAFRVISSVDSKTILDQTGANQLIGRGDMLISTGSSEPVRVQCAFIDTPEVDRVSSFIGEQQGFGGAYLLPEFIPEENGPGASNGRGDSNDRDDLFKEAARLLVREQQGSTSLIQRKMNLGYNRAGRIIDQLEEAGIVGPSEGSKARQVRITSLESLELILSSID